MNDEAIALMRGQPIWARLAGQAHDAHIFAPATVAEQIAQFARGARGTR